MPIERADWGRDCAPGETASTPMPLANGESASAAASSGGIPRPDWGPGGERRDPPGRLVLNNLASRGEPDSNEHNDDEDTAIELGMLRHGLTLEDVARIRGKAVEDVARPPIPPSAIVRELAEIDRVRRENRAAYNKDTRLQVRERELIELREKLQAGAAVEETETAAMSDDGEALPGDLLEAWESEGGVEHHLEIVNGTVQAVLGELEEAEAQSLTASFDRLPPDVTTPIYQNLSLYPGRPARLATKAEVQEFAGTDLGDLVAEWGNKAPVCLATIRDRINLMRAAMTPEARATFNSWFDGLPPGQARAVLKGLAVSDAAARIAGQFNPEY